MDWLFGRDALISRTEGSCFESFVILLYKKCAHHCHKILDYMQAYEPLLCQVFFFADHVLLSSTFLLIQNNEFENSINHFFIERKMVYARYYLMYNKRL